MFFDPKLVQSNFEKVINFSQQKTPMVKSEPFFNEQNPKKMRFRKIKLFNKIKKEPLKLDGQIMIHDQLHSDIEKYNKNTIKKLEAFK